MAPRLGQDEPLERRDVDAHPEGPQRRQAPIVVPTRDRVRRRVRVVQVGRWKLGDARRSAARRGTAVHRHPGAVRRLVVAPGGGALRATAPRVAPAAEANARLVRDVTIDHRLGHDVVGATANLCQVEQVAAAHDHGLEATSSVATPEFDRLRRILRIEPLQRRTWYEKAIVVCHVGQFQPAGHEILDVAYATHRTDGGRAPEGLVDGGLKASHGGGVILASDVRKLLDILTRLHAGSLVRRLAVGRAVFFPRTP